MMSNSNKHVMPLQSPIKEFDVVSTQSLSPKHSPLIHPSQTSTGNDLLQSISNVTEELESLADGDTLLGQTCKTHSCTKSDSSILSYTSSSKDRSSLSLSRVSPSAIDADFLSNGNLSDRSLPELQRDGDDSPAQPNSVSASQTKSEGPQDSKSSSLVMRKLKSPVKEPSLPISLRPVANESSKISLSGKAPSTLQRSCVIASNETSDATRPPGINSTAPDNSGADKGKMISIKPPATRASSSRKLLPPEREVPVLKPVVTRLNTASESESNRYTASKSGGVDEIRPAATTPSANSLRTRTGPVLAGRPIDSTINNSNTETSFHRNTVADLEHLKTRNPRDVAVSIAAEDECQSSQQPLSLEASGYEHDVFSETLLKSAANYLQDVTSTRIALAICEPTGKIVGIQTVGWIQSNLLVHRRCVESIARRMAKQPDILVSLDAIHDGDEGAQPGVGANAATAEKAFCVNVNELAQALDSPLIVLQWPLKKSGGFILLIVDVEKEGAKNEQLLNFNSSPNSSYYLQLAGDLDAWLVLRRCRPYLQSLRRLDWIRTRPKTVALTIASLCIFLLVPVPYLPKRECVLEPEKRQFISSPASGRVAECLVRPGDEVTAKQLLMRLDEDDVSRDLATAEADLERATRKFNAALALKSAGELGMAKVEIVKAQTLIASLKDKRQRLEIRADKDGIVVVGDWHKSIGAPVEIGQNLFEIAELDSMVAEVHLDANDLGVIQLNDAVSIRSDASGIHTFRGSISRIEPREKTDGGKAYFIADVIVDDPQRELRPGMKASANISAGWKSISWILFSRPLRWVANQWIW